MLKKTLLKNTKEFLEKNLSENLFLLKKSNKTQKKLLLIKGILLKKKILRFKQQNLRLLYQNSSSLAEKFSQKSQNLNKVFSLEKYNNFLVSMHLIKSEFEKRQTRSSDFKNKLKEKKKLSILYGNLSNKQIKKTLQQACKLRGNTGNNLIILLESRLDVILYKALFFPSIKSARQWINCNKILVNSRSMNIASYKAGFGDIISIIPENKKLVGNTILKFFLYYNFYKENNAVKPSTYKKNKLISSSEKKIIFNISQNIHRNKNKWKFFSTKKLQQSFSFKSNEKKIKLTVSKHINLYGSYNKNSFVTSNFSKTLLSLNKRYFTHKNRIGAINKNSFRDKHRYIISNFYFTLLQNQIKPINNFLLKQNVNKLNKFFKIKTYLWHTKTYKLFNKNNLSVPKLSLNNKCNYIVAAQHSKHTHFLKWHFFFYKKKLNIKTEILLSNINKKIIQQTKEIINLLLNSNYIHKMKKQFYVNNLVTLNSIKYYDILFFLKLKNLFFKKREMVVSENFSRKINFKPLNLEISYKTLTIIHLYPSQKILFPCSLDTELLLKGHI